MQFLENRPLSFLIVTIVYIIAGAAGIGLYFAIPLEPWLDLLIVDTISTIITFIFSVIFNNASVYDPYWSVQPIVIVIAFIINQEMTVVKIVMCIVICIWGVRLTANWAYTFMSLKHQDWRYTQIKENTGIFYPILNFIGIHMVPTIIVYSVVLPAVYIMMSPQEGNVGSYIIQGIADIQMHIFKKTRRPEEKFIRRGLWKYSRHPNYLGEILMWWGIGLATVCTVPEYWYFIFGALLNTLLFFFVSIPLAEGKQKKKEGYEQYKKETWALLPIPKCWVKQTMYTQQKDEEF